MFTFLKLSWNNFNWLLLSDTEMYCFLFYRKVILLDGRLPWTTYSLVCLFIFTFYLCRSCLSFCNSWQEGILDEQPFSHFLYLWISSKSWSMPDIPKPSWWETFPYLGSAYLTNTGWITCFFSVFFSPMFLRNKQMQNLECHIHLAICPVFAWPHPFSLTFGYGSLTFGYG